MRLLTNAKQYRKQCEILDRAGIRYVAGPNGEPATTWEAVNSVLRASEAQAVAQFNYDAIG